MRLRKDRSRSSWRAAAGSPKTASGVSRGSGGAGPGSSTPTSPGLLDGGVTEDGAPFLVMEYVDGLHIDRYCREHALTVPQRLQLFDAVCQAVSHAHRNLVVHRDLKPSQRARRAGKARSSCWTSGSRSSSTRRRAVGWFAGSRGERAHPRGRWTTDPAYAAPEQLAQGQVTTATDVYALGVLLYVLLSGQHPMGAAARSPVTLIRAIVEVEPRRMSDIVVSRTETPDALSSSRRPLRHDPGPAAPGASGRSRHDRRSSAEEERVRALRHGRGIGR